MRPELAILSFLCFILLIALTLLHVNSRNIAVLSLIGWLLVCSLIQGVDSVVWAGNVEIRSSVWCDIATKILLGARLAVPAACSCICFHLHFLSSNRDAKRRPHRNLFESTFCLIIPLIYMSLHIVVQNHRFDLVQDFGCIASIYPSAPALILVWIPPLVFCFSTLCFAGLALWSHIRRHQQLSDRAYLSSRLITVTFLRPLFTAIIISLLVFIVSLFDLAAALSTDGGLQTWVSLPVVHAEMSQVHVVPENATVYLERIEAWWWVIPISTLVFSMLALAGLVYCAHNDSGLWHHSPGKWLRSSLFRKSSADEFIQGTEGFSTRFSTRFTSPSPPPLTPVQLASGWDDSLRPSKTRPKPSPIICPLPPHSPSPSESGSESVTSVKTPSLAYLQSPASPDSPVLATPEAIVSPPRWSSLLSTPPPALSKTMSKSPAESILSSPWPQPPTTIPLSPAKGSASISPVFPVPSRRYLRPPSISSISASMVSSTISANAYFPPDPDVFLHNAAPPVHRAPFQDAGIPTTSAPLPMAQRSPRRIPSLESFHTRKLSVSSLTGGGRRKEKAAMGEAIYMTVVQETQDV